jgi:uncharacterized membrane protein
MSGRKNKASAGKTPDSLPVGEAPSGEMIMAQENQATQLRLEQRSLQFTGPLPPPHVLMDYNRINPEYADRIFNAADEERRHRHDMDKSHLKSYASHHKSAQIIGGIVSAMAVIGVVVCARLGSTEGTIACAAVATSPAWRDILLGIKGDGKPEKTDENDQA